MDECGAKGIWWRERQPEPVRSRSWVELQSRHPGAGQESGTCVPARGCGYVGVCVGVSGDPERLPLAWNFLPPLLLKDAAHDERECESSREGGRIVGLFFYRKQFEL